MNFFHFTKKLRIGTFLIALGMFFGVYGMVEAAAPTRGIGFQGQLFSGSTPVNASVSATFTFYDAASGGNVQGSPITKTVTVSNGYFSANFSESDLTGIDFSQSLWIEVVVNGDTLSPRSTINSVPLANVAHGVSAYGTMPVVGPAGALYFDTVSNELFVSDGSAWRATGSSSSTPATPFSTSTTRGVFSSTATGLDYSSTTGIFSLASGYNIPLIASTTAWEAKVSSQWAAAVGGINYAGGNVGIGTTTPSEKLAVIGNGIFSGNINAAAFYGDGSHLTGINTFSTSTTRGVFSVGVGLTYSSSTGVFAVATSTLGLTTTDIAEGTNQYFTNSRTDARINVVVGATTSLPQIVSLANLATVGTITSGTWQGTPIADAYLSKVGNWTGTFDGQEGAYYLSRANQTGTQTASTISDFGSAVNSYVNGSSTIPKTYASNTFTGSNTFNGAFTLGSVNGLLLGSNGAVSGVATSSLGLLTTHVAEGTNQYFTNSRADARFAVDFAGTTTDALVQGLTNKYYSDILVNSYLNASTTVAKTFTNNTFTGANAFTGGFTLGTLNGPLQANNGVVSSTSSIGVLFGGTGLTSAPTSGQILLGNGSGGYSLVSTSSLGIISSGGTVTSVAMTVPTGLSISGSPITSSGILALTLASGYTIPLLASTTEWDSAYANRITSATGPLTLSNHNLSLSTAGDWGGTFDGQEGVYYLNAANLTNFGTPFYSFFQATTTDALTEGSRLYFTNARARSAISESVAGLDFSTSTGILSLTSGYAIPLTASTTEWANKVSSQWATSGGSISYIAGNVGIGTINPISQLANTSTNTLDGAGTGSDLTNGLTWASNNPGYVISGVNNSAASNANGLFIRTTGTSSTNRILTLNANGADVFTVQGDGNVGVGTSTPGSLLSIGNTNGINFGAATSTFNTTGGINLASGCFAVNGTCLVNSTFGNADVNAYIHSSSTIAKTYSGNTFTGANIFNGALTFGTLNGPLQANNGVVSATSSIGVLYGGTGLTSAPTLGQILVGNVSGGYTLTATSSLGIAGSQWTTSGNNIYYSTGAVGIGTTTPFATLAVNPIAGQALNQFVVGSSTKTNFIIDNTGKVGIGTSTPFATLSVQAARPVIAIADTTAGGSSFLLRNGANGNKTFDIYDARGNTSMITVTSNFTNNGQVIIGTSSNSTSGNNSRLFIFGGTNGANIDTMGDATLSGGFGDTTSIEAEGSDWGTTGGVSSISMRYYGPAFPSGTTMGFNNQRLGVLDFGTASTSIIYTQNATPIMFGTNGTERMRLGATGNLGIGTTTPGSLLSLGDTNGINFATSATSTFNGTGGGINIASGCYAINGTCIGTGSASQWTTAGSDLYYATGNVGVGTSTPAGKLGVAGNAYIGGNLTATGTLAVLSTGTSSFAGGINITGSIVPTADDVYDLGSPTLKFRNLYLGAHSLYIDGQEVLQSQSSKIVVSASLNQTLAMQTSGSGDVEINPTGTGQILLKGNVRLTSGDSITTSLGGPVSMTGGASLGNLSLVNNTLSATNLNGGIAIAATGTGGIYFTQGNVGIGTTSPTSALSVVGAVAATGNITASAFYGDGSNLTGISQFATTTTRGLFSNTVTGLVYDNTTGTTSLAAGYVIPLTASTTEWANKVSSQWTTAGSSVYYNAGNVGIGTTTPGSILSLGNANGINFATSATSTFNGTGGGINIASGCYAINGTCIGTGSASQWITSGNNISYATGAVGVGTTTPFATFAVNPVAGQASNQFAVGSSTKTNFIIDNSGNVGIGTAAPTAKLHVEGSAYVKNTLKVDGSISMLDPTYGVGMTLTSGFIPTIVMTDDASSNLTISGGGHPYVSVIDSGNSVLSVNTLGNGYVGVGTSTPRSIFSIGTTNGINFSTATTTFHSTGGINLTEGGCYAINGTCIGTGSASQWITSGNNISYATGAVGVGTTTPFATFAVNPVAGQASNQFVVGSSTKQTLLLTTRVMLELDWQTQQVFYIYEKQMQVEMLA